MGLWETAQMVFYGFLLTYQQLDITGRLRRWWNGRYQIEEEKALNAMAKAPSKKGLTCIITGANSGVGYETAFHLAKTGYHIVFACRSEVYARKAIDKIKKKKGHRDLDLEFIQLDLASQESIRNFASEIKKKKLQVDCLINNAGVMWASKGYTKENIETHFGVNYLGHFLLTLLMLPLMTENARILTIGSATAELGSIPFDDLNMDKNYNKCLAYANSKLAVSHFTKSLSQKLKESKKKISVYCVDPGTVNTDITKSMPLILRFLYKTVGKVIFKNCWQGSCCTIYCCLSPELEGKSGSHYFEGNPIKNIPRGAPNFDQEREKLWTISEQMTGEKFPF